MEAKDQPIYLVAVTYRGRYYCGHCYLKFKTGRGYRDANWVVPNCPKVSCSKCGKILYLIEDED